MIPKKLHYIWFGPKKSELAQKCIDSFHKYMSEFEIIEWNESNIDPNKFSEPLRSFFLECYYEKKYAFCSDISRLYILKKYGGIYVDTDVEFIKTLPDEFLKKEFLCRDNPIGKITCGSIWGVEPNNKLVMSSIRWFRDYMETHQDTYGDKWIYNHLLRAFFNNNGYDKDKDIIQDIAGFRIYSMEYFSPKNYKTQIILKTQNTISIHHYDGSWNPRMEKFKIKRS